MTTDFNPAAFGREMRAARRAQSMTHKKLAEKTGCGRATIIRYEQGKAKMYEHVEKIRAALGMANADAPAPMMDSTDAAILRAWHAATPERQRDALLVLIGGKP